MTDKIQRVSNPLTIIAIFAGLAEIAATVALGLLPERAQMIFLWFVMLFPVLLVSLFFLVLWKMPGVLYGPSDYRDEENFMKSVAKAETKLKVEKVISGVNESAMDEGVKEKVISDLNELKETINEYVETEGSGDSKNYIDVDTVLKLVVNNPGVSIQEIAVRLKSNRRLVLAAIKVLEQEGFIEKYKKNQAHSPMRFSATNLGMNFLEKKNLVV